MERLGIGGVVAGLGSVVVQVPYREMVDNLEGMHF